MSVSPIGSQVHWIRMSSHGTAARVSPVQGGTQAPCLWECTLYRRCPGLLLSPPPAFPQSNSPPDTPLPHFRADFRQARRRIQHLSVYRQGRLLFSWFSQTEPSLTSVLCAVLSWAIFSLPWWNVYTSFFLYFSILIFPLLRKLGEESLGSQRFPPPCWDSIGGVTFFSVMFVDATRF